MRIVVNSSGLVRKKVDIYLVIYLFFVLFCPPFFSKYIAIFLLTLYTIFALVLVSGRWSGNLKNINILPVLKKIGILVLYWLIVTYIGMIVGKPESEDRYFKIAYRFLMLIISLGVFVTYTYTYCEKKNYSKNMILKHIIYASSLQFIILGIFILVPSIRKVALNVMSRNTGSGELYSGYEISRRFYGFAMTLQDGFSYGISLAAIIALYLAINESTKYTVYYIMLIVVAALNARTGLLIIAIGTIFLLLQKISAKTIRFILLSLFAGITGLYILRLLLPTTMEWMTGGLLQLRDFLLRREYGNYGNNIGNSMSALFSQKFWIVPSSMFEIIFGTGHASAGLSKTDVGYINYIWAFGVVGSLYLYYILFKMYRTARRKCRELSYKKLLDFVIISMIIGNIKFDVITYAAGIIIILLLFTCDERPSSREPMKNREISEIIEEKK